jgi:hypothetical protein
VFCAGYKAFDNSAVEEEMRMFYFPAAFFSYTVRSKEYFAGDCNCLAASARELDSGSKSVGGER